MWGLWYAAGRMTIRGERRAGEVVTTVDGAPLDWRLSLAVRNDSPTGPAWGLRRVGPGPGLAGPAGRGRVDRSSCGCLMSRR